MASEAQVTTARWRGMAGLRWLDAFRQREDQLLLVLALIIGALTGLTVVAFIVLTERLGVRLYPVGSAAWHRVLIPILGSTAMGWVVYRYFPDARGSGVMATKAALFARDGYISARTTFGKFFCTTATLASGIPLGPEGPSVQVGAGLASVLGRRLGLKPSQVKALIPIGAAAAIAAAFNTPLAAVIFALEEIMGDLNAPVLGSVVLASGASWLVLRLLLGNSPLFHVPQYQLVHPIEFAFYAVLGVAGGFVSFGFTQSLIRMRRWFLQLPRWSVWMQPAVGGIVAGLMAWWVPQVLGVGYGYVGDALNGRMALEMMALLVVLKLVAVTTSYASGNAGGVFAPSLFMGAMFGGTIGSIAHHFLPAYTAQPGAYALVGMGALFAGIIRAPITSVLMIFETTQDYAVIVPVMIANFVSYFVASHLEGESIYEQLAVQDGIHLPGGASQRRKGERQVSQMLRPPANWLAPEKPLSEAMEEARGKEFRTFLVGDGKKVIGVVSVEQIAQALAKTAPAETGVEGATGAGSAAESGTVTGAKASAKKVGDLVDGAVGAEFPHVHADHALHVALERMGAGGLDILPVVSRADVHYVLGIVNIEDVLSSYGVPRWEKTKQQE